jgi:HEAT repeat protein
MFHLFLAISVLLVLVVGNFSAAQDDPANQIELNIKALNVENSHVRERAAHALAEIGPAAVPALVAAMGDPNWAVREGAARALGDMGSPAAPALPALIKALDDENIWVQWWAGSALVRIGPPAVPLLVIALGDKNAEVRRGAAAALGEIRPATGAVLAALIAALRDGSGNVRSQAAISISKMGSIAEAAVPTLMETLKDPEPDVRGQAAQALGQTGLDGESAVPALIEALRDAEPAVRGQAAQALALIATALQDTGVVGAVGVLRQARDALAAHQDAGVREYVAPVRRTVAYLELQEPSYVIDEIIPWMEMHPTITAAVVLVPAWLLSCLSLSLLLLWIHPIAILHINDALRPLELTLPDRIGGMKIALRHLLLFGFLNYRPRVLDAWVARHVDAARRKFKRKRTVHERSVYVPVSVELDRKVIPELRGQHLRSIFGVRGTGRLLIWGEGGAGKTSLACQIALWGISDRPDERPASHRALPVLIERELDFEVAEGKDPFTETVRGDLSKLISAPVSENLITALLEQGRVLVIVDHMSEMTEANRNRVRPDVPDFPAASLIVTSRLEEKLGNVSSNSLKPMRVTGDYLFEFMGAYLRAQGVREWFPDREFGPAGARIAELVGERPVTVLLVKLYLDRMIETKRRQGDLDREMPESIPSLMLYYLNDINAAVREDVRRDARAVHRDAEAIAWACLKESLWPEFASIDSASKPALAAIDSEGVDARLDYLERRLGLIETREPKRDKVRFLLDPVAEYLAGLHLVERYRADEGQWRKFLKRTDAKSADLKAIRGFLLAVRDCCLAQKADEAVPEFLPDEIAKRAGLDLETLEQARVRERVARYTAQLKAFDPKDRRIAAEALMEIGTAAESAIAELIKALKDEDGQVRHNAVLALWNIGSESSVPALVEVLRDSNALVRADAAVALRQVGPQAKGVVPALVRNLNDEDDWVRVTTAEVLGDIGPAAELAVPALIDALKDPDVRVRRAAACALGQIGPAARPALPALSAALKDEDAGVSGQAAEAMGAIEDAGRLAQHS